ncbi:MAG TPA: ANTAR domain-containing protein [Jatrophihabitans sp.]|jgi:AmiR/NasT family two-component response regulator
MAEAAANRFEPDPEEEVETLHAKVGHLETALCSSRRIGMALGILMAQRNWTEEQAFDAMRDTSQHRHVKLRELAEQVVLTGTLDEAGETS